MTQEYTWVMSELRARFRALTGLSSTSDLSDNEVDKRINEYYLNYFPGQAGVDDLHTIWAGTTSPYDDGTLALAQTDLRLKRPVFRNNDEIELYWDYEAFRRKFKASEQYVEAPSLDIGSSDDTKVANSAFTYEIDGYTHSADAAETAFSGLNTVPQNKYGAFAVKIDEDGTITITEADDNSDGYNTAAEAIDDLDAADSESAFMGFVVVKPTAAAGFVPGTTSMTSSIAWLQDGKPENRYPPEAVCVFEEKLHIGPKADDTYRITAPQLTRGTALESDDSNALPDKSWGPAIALGAAILYLTQEQHDHTEAKKLSPIFDMAIKSISSKYREQIMGGAIHRSF